MKLQELIDRNEIVYNKALRTKSIYDSLDTSKYVNLEDIENPLIFYQLISTQSVQAKAPATEKFIIKRMKGSKNKPSSGNGDFSLNNHNYELKISFLNKGNKLNLRQIRLWQPIDFYLCCFINDDYLSESYCFLLSKEDMIKEVDLIGGFTHGTLIVNKENIHSEYSITIDVYNDRNSNTQRWKQNFLNASIKKQIIGEFNEYF